MEIFGIKLNYDEKCSAHADICLSFFTKTNSVKKRDQVKYFKDLLDSVPDFRKNPINVFN